MVVAAAPAYGQFTASPDPPIAGSPVVFTPVAPLTPVLWTFGAGANPAGAASTVSPFSGVTTYASPGVKTVTMTPTGGLPQSRVISVAPNTPPAAQFAFYPPSPVVGQEVIFESFSVDAGGPIASTEWDFAYDGTFHVDATGPKPTVKFATRGTRTVALRVRDSASPAAGDLETKPITIGPAPASPLPVAQFAVSPLQAAGRRAGVAALVLLRPGRDDRLPALGSRRRRRLRRELHRQAPPSRCFPRRASGSCGSRSATRTAGSKRRPRTSLSRLNLREACRSSTPSRWLASRAACTPAVSGSGSSRCGRRRARGWSCAASGNSCPDDKITKTSKRKPVRFKRMTRFLRAGTILKVSIRKSGQIGKYTRWIIRGGKLPKRKDLCLYPGKSKGRRCPTVG